MRRLVSGGIWRRLKDSQGAALIEATVVLPLVLLVVFAVLEFGGILFAQMALQNGVSQATRFAVTRNVLTGLTREQSIRTTMRKETPTLTLDDASIVFSNMTPGTGVWVAGTGAPGSIERVTVTYNWKIMTPFMKIFFPLGAITIRANSAMKNESVIE